MPTNAQLFDDEWLLDNLQRAINLDQLWMAKDEVQELLLRFRELKESK